MNQSAYGCNSAGLQYASEKTEKQISKQKRLTKYDYGMYHGIWTQFDPDGSQYIRFDQLYDFLDALKPPLRIPKPNKFKSIAMDIPICKGDLMHRQDILDAVKSEFYAQRGVFNDDCSYEERISRPDVKGYENLSSTLWRNREEYSARIIQRAWNKHKQSKEDENAGASALEDNADEAGLDYVLRLQGIYEKILNQRRNKAKLRAAFEQREKS